MARARSSRSFTAAQIAESLHGEVLGDGSVELTGVAPADAAQTGDLTYAEKTSYLAAAEQSPASAILVSDPSATSKKVLIRVQNPRIALARVLPLFFPTEKYSPGVHPSAVIDPSVQVPATLFVGPHCVIGKGVTLGERSVLMGGNHLGHDCQIAEDACLHPNVVLYPNCRIGQRVTIHAGTVIGSDGYGYVLDEGRHRKVLQVGNVIIHDDVEIGANAAIDRGALGSTVIGQGTKIDNLVHIAHNVVVGRHCIIMGQAGFGGSTRLDDYCVIASQAGVADHLRLGQQATVGAKSGVMRDVPDHGVVVGSPAAPDKQMKRQWIALKHLPELIRRMRELEKELEELRSAGDRRI
jgi:UDP-3-O-[3-hydroxymyristoyl] glucosamine N-acyltransferase